MSSAVSSAAPSAEAIEGFLALAGRAPVIFAGEVVSITRADERGFVDVEFAVRHAVRGCPVSGSYVLREWAGLWTGGVTRYHIGQRLLLLLAARGPSGMSAPVGGMDGAIPLVPGGDTPLVNASGVPAPDRGGLTGPVAGGDILRAGVDLRWVETHAVRAGRGTSAGSHTLEPQADRFDRPGESAWAGPARPIHRPVSTGGRPTPPALADVLALLGRSPVEAHATHR